MDRCRFSFWTRIFIDFFFKLLLQENINHSSWTFIQRKVKKIKNHLDKILENYEILLRLNCEGVEDEIIYSCEKIFNKKLKLIMGAVDDVKKIKSEIIYNDLIIFMEEKNLKFTYFTPDPNTWLKAHETIYKTFKLSK